jgi:hypothetical protein
VHGAQFFVHFYFQPFASLFLTSPKKYSSPLVEWGVRTFSGAKRKIAIVGMKSEE